MSDLLGDGVMHQPESNTYSEDFEKLEPDSTPDSLAEQDEEVTTTGDEAEEDRYVAGASVSDKLIEFDDESPQQSSQPSFNPDPEPFPNDSPPPTRQSGSPPPAYSQYSEFSNPPPKSFEADTTSVKKELNTIMEPTEVAKPPEGSWMKNIDPRVLGLIYWRDVKKSGLVFGSMMFILLSLLFFSVMSVLAYLSLAVLTVTLSFRVYKNVLQAVQKTGDGHPFKQYLEMNIELPDDKVQKAVQTVMKHVNCTVRELRRLFLIEDIVDSVKFGLLLWVLTYVGSCFNGMTLAILGVVSIFTIPKIYETYKVQIDNYVNMARTQLSKIMGQIMSKMPFPKKKVKSQ
ncbi:hypothetical protein ScPMuIL_014681 [Solemya velum]